ncbi:MAG: hypothetical protein DSZ29_05340 [Aquificaceae bacterium]|nr:MAG: hypothetical protein DSZ29_05340 [Aquificaceae bacterium]
MATQKKYHDLVILDHENVGAKQISAKKLISGILFFIIGIFIGALLISILNNKNSSLITQAPPVTTQSSSSNGSDIAPITTELQSITSITPSAKEGGCGIESLGRNNPEGCSADAFTETPLNPTEDSTTEVTDLNFLDTPDNTVESNSAPESGMTNILDLK